MEKFDQDILDSLEDIILTQFPDILRHALENANNSGKLRELLRLLYLDRLLPHQYRSEALPTGKILVFTGHSVKGKDLLGIAKRLGISKDRFEFYDYEQSKTYRYSQLEHNSVVSAVLFGAVPHKTVGAEDSSSIVSNLERKAKDGVIYARILRLYANNKLKLTKTNFREALIRLICEGSVRAA
jgi:hypothetical protein